MMPGLQSSIEVMAAVVGTLAGAAASWLLLVVLPVALFQNPQAPLCTIWFVPCAAPLLAAAGAAGAHWFARGFRP